MKLSDSQHGWLILGLGNDGKYYKNSRHNYGFEALDSYCIRAEFNKWRKKSFFYYCYSNSRKMIAAKPRTMMNLSGIAARKLVNKLKIETDRILALYDDVDIELGTLRVKKSGGAGGHNGMRSLIDYLGTENFPRIRLGIRPTESSINNMSDYVLSDFTSPEKLIIEKVFNHCSDAINLIVHGQITDAMNRYNRKTRE